MRLEINTGSLAVLAAKRTTATFIGIKAHLEQRESGHKTQQCANRTNRVAIGTAVPPGQNKDNYECNSRYHEGRHTANPHICAVESIAVYAFTQVGKSIVAQFPNGLEQICRNSAVTAVGSQQCDKSPNAHHESCQP
jgi:hypothetical protein